MSEVIRNKGALLSKSTRVLLRKYLKSCDYLSLAKRCFAQRNDVTGLQDRKSLIFRQGGPTKNERSRYGFTVEVTAVEKLGV